MSGDAYDLFVIGGGSGGVRAARRAAESGAKVAIAEEYRFGGTCVIRGCVPKKLLVYASSFPEYFAASEGFGWSLHPACFDWKRLIENKDREIARLELLYRTGLQRAGVELIDGRATLRGPDRIQVAGQRDLLKASHVLIATGGWPHVPRVPGREHAVTSNEVFGLVEFPDRVLIVGGGYIACEFACIFRGLGATVLQVYRGPLFLRGFDDDLREFAVRELRRHGIDVRFQHDVAAIRKTTSGLEVSLNSGEAETVDLVLYATGRKPVTDGMGLRAAGIELGKKGEVLVDALSATNVPTVYAVGDVTDRLNQTPVAIREAEAFVETVFGGIPTPPNHSLVPLAVFTRPELATVGLTEAEARRLYDVEIYRTEFQPLMQALGGTGERTMFKLVVERASRRILGIHLGGHGAAELIQCLAIAVRMGATKDDFDHTIAVHPTSAEEIVTLRNACP